MIPAEVNIQIDKKAIQQHIEMKLAESIQAQLWFVDLNKMAELTSMSPRFLESEVLCDVRMRAIEIKKVRKRWWPAELALQVITEITNEW